MSKVKFRLLYLELGVPRPGGGGLRMLFLDEHLVYRPLVNASERRCYYTYLLRYLTMTLAFRGLGARHMIPDAHELSIHILHTRGNRAP